eukprot:NODE_4798_length_739_cov_26.839869_g4636_i0.p1 GENE.NODE_4798_length_739_cov_26.839869_g4636_i0~~NODE_4798_length_739_cov_26.839869_g4636_i0.p1  ORF type:complete len:225 (+),score=67.31 NODE_4798_length_739_cov_26.839869_g4636_i0:58-675(+)
MLRGAFVRLQHSLPKLPFPVEQGIPPVISAKQLDLHFNKHHNTYVVKLNGLTAEPSPLAGRSLEEIIMLTHTDPAQRAIFNNAAQHYNHSFYWSCLTPNGKPMPQSLLTKLEETFGSLDAFKEQFTQSALANFGSGWTWLVKDESNVLAIRNTSNAEVPLTDGCVPLLTCDVWEHAYYVDYLNQRDAYLKAFWNIVDWEAVGSRL